MERLRARCRYALFTRLTEKSDWQTNHARRLTIYVMIIFCNYDSSRRLVPAVITQGNRCVIVDGNKIKGAEKFRRHKIFQLPEAWGISVLIFFKCILRFVKICLSHWPISLLSLQRGITFIFIVGNTEYKVGHSMCAQKCHWFSSHWFHWTIFLKPNNQSVRHRCDLINK